MSGGSRKYHSKSRTGCSQCKRRRKKCDETPPICSNCRKSGIVCDYDAWSQAVSRTASEVFGWNIGTVRIADPLPLASLDQRDVELFRFYAARTSFTLSGTRTLAIWQSSTPDEAKSHAFLMHSMLALTALHGCFTSPGGSVDYASIASRHHEAALEAFRTSISEVKRENGRAVALFSLLTTIFSCGVPLVRGFPDGASPVSISSVSLGCYEPPRLRWAASATVSSKDLCDHFLTQVAARSPAS
ncbi:hypothetical protein IQ07DRAFT_109912 [Pyrenochaeta sp. DS3sAY3a]|nr:hypothetical protein IQ07DRAFT_109912 [Pyrenochaeta sp. DS3sAY3a]